jgi:hypothetical protein
LKQKENKKAKDAKIKEDLEEAEKYFDKLKLADDEDSTKFIHTIFIERLLAIIKNDNKKDIIEYHQQVGLPKFAFADKAEGNKYLAQHIIHQESAKLLVWFMEEFEERDQYRTLMYMHEIVEAVNFAKLNEKKEDYLDFHDYKDEFDNFKPAI